MKIVKVHDLCNLIFSKKHKLFAVKNVDEPPKARLCHASTLLFNFLKHLGKLQQTISRSTPAVRNNAHKSHLFNPYCGAESPCVCMKVITVGFDVVVCPEFSSFRSGSGCSTPLILHMGNPAVIRIGRAGGEIDFICRIIDVTKMLFV